MSADRIGIGTDVHGVSSNPSRPMWLAGVLWPDVPGLEGHSDADVVAHAICDAMLGAAALGDLGAVFGTSDPQWADASGISMLVHTAGLVRDAGFAIVHVSVQVIGNEPKIGTRRQEAQDILSAAIGAPVSVSGTTTDGLGLTGRGEGIAATAVALLRSR